MTVSYGSQQVRRMMCPSGTHPGRGADKGKCVKNKPKPLPASAKPYVSKATQMQRTLTAEAKVDRTREKAADAKAWLKANPLSPQWIDVPMPKPVRYKIGKKKR